VKTSAVPIVKDLVLVGGGHSHVAVLKQFGMNPVPGVRITMICRDPHTPYSGMLPGFIAGHYTFDEAHIDLRPLCVFAGARFYADEVVTVDLAEKRVRCAGRPPVPYDLVSFNIGSTPATAATPGAEAHAVPVKPIHRFVAHWERMKERVLTRRHSTQIGVVGGGAGGVELILAIQYRLGTLLSEQGRSSEHLAFHLLTDQAELLTAHGPAVAAKFRRVLDDREIRVHRSFRVASVGEREVTSDAGARLELDEILWVTQAGAAPWLRESGLAVDAEGFMCVADTLESTSHAGVFGAGDTAAMIHHPRPKSGVFAVRQGPPLARNLRRALLGQPLRPFRPQKNFLSLISTGDRYAIASRAGWAAEGAYLWTVKDWIDRRFMRKYSELPEMPEQRGQDLPTGLADQEAIAAISALAMRCGGCGAKVGATVLSRALSQLQPVERPDVLIGLHAPDDAAVVAVPAGKVMVQSVDSFRAIVDDPYLFGRIAANHSLGDLYAMGSEPQSALAIATVPYGLESKTEDTLTQMMAGAMEVLREANVALVGGHTSEGAELSLGFAVNGLIDAERVLRKSGMRPGDALVLTKAIGTGTLFAADMRHKSKGRWIQAAIDSMLLSNRAAAGILLSHGATSCTDITGFGLLGHLIEMVRPSQVDVDLWLDKVPILEGAAETVARGIVSSLQPQNVRLRRAIRNLEESAKDPRYPLLFDPQTAGGLLASVPAEHVEDCLTVLRRAGYLRSAMIGVVRAQSEHLEPVLVL
jgi:selenide, water dikinase